MPQVPDKLTLAKHIGNMIVSAAVAIGGAYGWAESHDLIGNKLERVNRILAQAHVGERPVSEVVVLDEEGDYQAVLNYENEDVLFYRKYKDQDGNRQTIRRWTTKKTTDQILEMADLREEEARTTVGLALIYPESLPLSSDEVWIGVTEDGFSVYHVVSEDVCLIVDEGTGETISVLPPPCEQYVVPASKTG